MQLVEFTKNTQTGDKYFIVSDEDYELVKQYKWALGAADKSGNRYVRMCNKAGTRLHRFLLKITNPKIRVDHKNMNTLDNTRENLRICNSSLNAANKSRQKNKKSSKFKGVFKRAKKYRAMIGFNNKIINLGTFETEELAAKAYDEKALELFGEFANLNFKEI